MPKRRERCSRTDCFYLCPPFLLRRPADWRHLAGAPNQLLEMIQCFVYSVTADSGRPTLDAGPAQSDWPNKRIEKSTWNRSKALPYFLQHIHCWRRSSSRDDRISGIMYSFTNISKTRFGIARSATTATPSQPTKVALTITLEHFDNLSIPKTFATGDEIGGYLSMEMPESTKFDAVSITLEGSRSMCLCHHLSSPALRLVSD